MVFSLDLFDDLQRNLLVMGLGFHGLPGEAVRTVADWNSHGSYLLKFGLELLRHVSLTNRLRVRRR